MDENENQPDERIDPESGEKWRDKFFKLEKSLEKREQKARDEGHEAGQKAYQRQAQASKVVSDLNIPSIDAEIVGARFAQESPDEEPTEEALRTFITTKVGVRLDTEAKAQESTPEAGATKPEAFHQTTPTQAPTGRISYEEYRRRVTNPAEHAEALRLRREGQVDDPVPAGRT